jgi:hypothetical protein
MENEKKDLDFSTNPAIGGGGSSPADFPPPPPPPVETGEKPKRGRKPGSTLARREAESGGVDRLFSPENFRALAVLPGETAFAMSGWEGWLVSKEEERSLSETASFTAKYYLQNDPKYVALSMFLVNLAVIYGTRTVAYYQEKREKEKASGKK